MKTLFLAIAISITISSIALAQGFPDKTVYSGGVIVDAGSLILMDQTSRWMDGVRWPCTYGSPETCGPWDQSLAGDYTWIGSGIYMHNPNPSITFCGTGGPYPWDGGYCYNIEEDTGVLAINGVRQDDYSPQADCQFNFAELGSPEFECEHQIASGSFLAPQIILDPTDAGGFPESMTYYLETRPDEVTPTQTAVYFYTATATRNFYWDNWFQPGNGWTNMDFHGVQHLTRVPSINGITLGQYGDAGQLPTSCGSGSIGYDLLDNAEYICIGGAWKTVTHS